jgi:hypothetical protein
MTISKKEDLCLKDLATKYKMTMDSTNAVAKFFILFKDCLCSCGTPQGFPSDLLRIGMSMTFPPISSSFSPHAAPKISVTSVFEGRKAFMK